MNSSPRTLRLDLPGSQPPPCGVSPGDMLGKRYLLEAPLGWGGLAVVFQAIDTHKTKGQRRQVPLLAVKVLRADLAPDIRQEAIELLRWEAHLLRRLRHPALPRLSRFYSDQTTAWMARDLIAGTPLSFWASQAPCDPEMVRGWAVQLCDMLCYLHTRSPVIICGDLKPANLILRSDGSLAFIDLGSAHTRTQRPPRRPRPRYGTPGYASPEQLGQRNMDERSDLFSLGVICYELITGNDPTTAPLQFDLPYLDAAAPMFAPALRWALEFDLQHRAPTAAALRAAFVLPTPPEPLNLGYRLNVCNESDLMAAAIRHPQLLERTLVNGALDTWLAVHPDRALGVLLHQLRDARQKAPSRQRPIDTFFSALSPAEGSPLLQATPDTIQFGDIPLRRWRLWSRPQSLVLHNTARRPLRWEIECPAHVNTEVRLMVAGRPQRRLQGVLPPGGTEELQLVAAGRAGKRSGSLTLRCGLYNQLIFWDATARAGIYAGHQFVECLEQLDLTQPGLLPALEELLQRGILQRWLHAQGKRKRASELDTAANQSSLTPLERRLLIVHMLHPLDPQRFPRLHIHSGTPTALSVTAGAVVHTAVEVENQGQHACRIIWHSQNTWVHVEHPDTILHPGQRLSTHIMIAPTATQSAGQQQVTVELHSGALVLPLIFSVQVIARSWWRRVLEWVNDVANG